MSDKPITQRCDRCGADIQAGLRNLLEHVNKEHRDILKYAFPYTPMTLKQFGRMWTDFTRDKKAERKIKNHERYERRKQKGLS